MNVEIGAEAALFQEKEYISGIFIAVWIFPYRFIKYMYYFFPTKHSYEYTPKD
jgi:hypothetical protein